MKDVDIFNAVDYALRKEGVREIAWSEDGEYEIEICYADSLMPFIRVFLEELQNVK